jgi:GTPase SAR1 family protein
MVGKSSIVLRYVKDEFDKNLERTVNASACTKAINVNNTNFLLNIWVCYSLNIYHNHFRIQLGKKNIML